MAKSPYTVEVSPDLYAKYITSGGISSYGNPTGDALYRSNRSLAINNAAIALAEGNFGETDPKTQGETLRAIKKYPELFSPNIVAAMKSLVESQVN